MSATRASTFQTAAGLAIALAFAAFPSSSARADDTESEAISDESDEEDDVDPIEERKRDEADRVHVSGRGEGSLASPIVFKDESRLEKLCSALQGEKHAPADADLNAHAAARRAALRDVYTIVVAPGGFKVGDYKKRASRLPLRLEHPFTALDGAVRLIIAQKAGGAFDVPAKDAAAILAAIDEKRLGLEVMFRVDNTMSDTIAPCFSYPKSAAYALNIEPLSYALVELGNNNKRLAETKTPMFDDLKAWMEPGKARLAIVASSEGPIDSDALTKAIEAKRTDLEACFGALMQSMSGTGMVAYEASVMPSGAVTDVRVEAEALDDDATGACAAKILAAVGVQKAPKSSRAHVALSIERGEEDAPLLTD